LAVAHLWGKESLGCICLSKKAAIGLCIKVYLPLYFLFGYQRENRVILAGSGEFKLTIISKVSEAIDYIFMATVYQHVSQDAVEVYGYSSVGILLKDLE
jgi:hypothetical protein